MLSSKLFIVIICLTIFGNISLAQKQETTDPFLKKALAFKFKNQDSSYYYFKTGYKLRLKEKDTLSAINLLIEESNLYAHNVNYEKAYDGYWEALFLADESNDSISKHKIYQGLGWLYSFYNRNDEALKYFNASLDIKKKLVAKKELDLDYLSENYFSILSYYRVNKNYEKAKVYLDSLGDIRKKRTQNPEIYYHISESGYLDAINGNYNSAIKKLHDSKDFFQINTPEYLVIIYALLGDVYQKMRDYNNSIINYKKALEVSNKYKSHIDYKLKVNEALFKIYQKQKKYKDANFHLLESKKLNDEIFGSKSKNNQHLLEIKDKYRLKKDEEADLLKQQHIIQLENEERIWLLKSIILTVSTLSIALIAFLYIRHQRNKHIGEKKILKEKQKLKIKKKEEILELKNKELTASALRLIEKDEFISNIKKRLSNQKEGNIDIQVINRILKSIQGNPNNNWKEFETTFTAINNSFYTKLKDTFPKLSQTDQKICALVKLNFSSKKMSKLLGISVESVHTSRHRLRKKLGINRNENLEEFINKF